MTLDSLLTKLAIWQRIRILRNGYVAFHGMMRDTPSELNDLEVCVVTVEHETIVIYVRAFGST